MPKRYAQEPKVRLVDVRGTPLEHMIHATDGPPPLLLS